jgi:hypothetical protein
MTVPRWKIQNNKGGDMSEKDDLYTAGKIAKELGVKPGEVKKAITALNLEPDVKKGNCSYFWGATVKKIKKELS